MTCFAREVNPCTRPRGPSTTAVFSRSSHRIRSSAAALASSYAFAVGRTQDLIYLLAEHYVDWGLDKWQIYLDSPMAINASEILCAHLGEHRLTDEQCRSACGVAR